MHKSYFLILSVLLNYGVIAQTRQTISYDGKVNTSGKHPQNASIAIMLDILRGTDSGVAIYTERHGIVPDSGGKFHIEIGAGKPFSGQFDSITWSDGKFYLQTKIDGLEGTNYSLPPVSLIRVPPELSNDYEQGTVNATQHPDYGEWRFVNNRKRRPGLITIDLSTSYANLAYPADTYPVYRHYEWSDPDRDGIGNSFMISYSDHTNNSFIEKSTLLGDVKLYATAFQEIRISSTSNEILVSITKPVPVKNLSETYAIKGPWKFIYYIEW